MESEITKKKKKSYFITEHISTRSSLFVLQTPDITSITFLKWSLEVKKKNKSILTPKGEDKTNRIICCKLRFITRFASFSSGIAVIFPWNFKFEQS